MAYTIRDLIIREIVLTLENYSWTAVTSPTVYKGLEHWSASATPPPLVTVLPRLDENAGDEYGKHVLSMPVDIVCLSYLASGANPSEQGEAIHGELILAVFGKETTDAGGDPLKSGGVSMTYIDSISYRRGGTQYPGGLADQVLHTGIEILIGYQTNIGDPFSQD